jgi:prophage tail gpP-like protein
MTDEVVSLLVGDRPYVGWKSVTVHRAIDALSGSFSLTLSDKWGVEQVPIEILPEDACSLFIGQDPIITGYIDEISGSEAAREHDMAITGRDKTKDLIDCSVKDCPYTFANIPLLSILESIVQPYSIKTVCDSDILPIRVDRFSIQPGETCFEAIDRACRMAGVLPQSTVDGEVRLTRAGRQVQGTDLVLGTNIKSYSYRFSTSNRFATYKVLGQRSGSDTSDPAASAQILGEAVDPAIGRGRTLVIHGIHAADKPSAVTRARWEAAVRAGRSGMLTVTLQGWRDDNGYLWEINRIVDVCIPRRRLDYEPMLVGEVEFTKSREAGTITKLSLCRPDAFSPEPLPDKHKACKTRRDPWSAVRIETGSML